MVEGPTRRAGRLRLGGTGTSHVTKPLRRDKLAFDDPTALQALCGTNNARLKLVERTAGVELHLRGNEITIEADEAGVEVAKAALEQLYAFARKGKNLASDDVVRAVKVLRADHRAQIADIFGVEEGRISVIPNGIDPEDLPAEDPQELARLRSQFAAPEENLVLLIGRLVYEKGFQLALEAMPEVIAALPNTRFLVAGSGTHEAELHKQANELGLMEHGTFLGWIGDDVLHSLYRIADLTVVPSIYEPFGLVALEAMASECPCIAADTGGLREVVPIEGAGLRFRASDAEHLAEAAIQVLGDPELGKRMVEEGLAHIRMFDWNEIAQQTLDLYESLAIATDSAS